ncbi:hypothetical protein D9611_008314 [Ephemerocybe angulata]|uniref:Uncharacterized protein n=1 Tax=Ephemerocybe angulata TaxID=980116 RepID=A0A8H5BIE1_9AGAR|nr:hypothetical protein D9611_008314 [Tulosesus angulatus]
MDYGFKSFKFGGQPPAADDDTKSEAPSPTTNGGPAFSKPTRHGHHHKHSMSYGLFSFLEYGSNNPLSLSIDLRHTRPTPCDGAQQLGDLEWQGVHDGDRPERQVKPGTLGSPRAITTHPHNPNSVECRMVAVHGKSRPTIPRSMFTTILPCPPAHPYFISSLSGSANAMKRDSYASSLLMHQHATRAIRSAVSDATTTYNSNSDLVLDISRPGKLSKKQSVRRSADSMGTQWN